MGKLPIALKAMTSRKVTKLLDTSKIAIAKLEKAKQQGLLPKEKVDSWIAEIKKEQKAAKKDIKENELETDT